MEEKKMKKIEKILKEVEAANGWLARALIRLDISMKEEEGTVTLRVQYEAEREDAITIPTTSLYDVREGNTLFLADPDECWVIATRRLGPLAGKAFYLNTEYDWEIGRDNVDALCLVPIKKEVKREGNKNR